MVGSGAAGVNRADPWGNRQTSTQELPTSFTPRGESAFNVRPIEIWRNGPTDDLPWREQMPFEPQVTKQRK